MSCRSRIHIKNRWNTPLFPPRNSWKGLFLFFVRKGRVLSPLQIWKCSHSFQHWKKNTLLSLWKSAVRFFFLHVLYMYFSSLFIRGAQPHFDVFSPNFPFLVPLHVYIFSGGSDSRSKPGWPLRTSLLSINEAKKSRKAHSLSPNSMRLCLRL